MAGQALSVDVRLAGGGGLLVDATGVQVDFGTGHSQVDHTHPAADEVVPGPSDTAEMMFELDGGALVCKVKLDGDPGAGKAPLSVQADGIDIQLQHHDPGGGGGPCA